jgi:tripartite-type tricarboxylate transporter receptor subunit TctC
MKFTERQSARLSIAAALFLTPALAAGQNYPSKPIRLIIPQAPSGGGDVIARALGARLFEALGQAIVYDNRAGAGGSIGTDLAAKAPPDGHTLLIVTSAHAINPALYTSLPYDSEKSFTPVALVASSSFVLSVHPSVPVRSLKQFVALVKARPGELNYGSGGNGSSNHLAMEYFKMIAGVNLLHVPYKGGAAATIALLSGEVATTFASPPQVIPHVKAKRLAGIAVTNKMRLPALPQLPTVAESGYPGYLDTGWYGILVPAGTPKQIVDRLNLEIVKIQQTTQMQEFLTKQGLEPPIGSTPEDFARLIKTELDKWGKVAAKAGIRPGSL